MTSQNWDPWSYREGVDPYRRDRVGDGELVDDVTSGTTGDVTGRQHDLVGFKVEAVDGSIGKIDGATDEVGGSYVVVDTGPWIFGRKVMLPAGTISQVDWENGAVYVDRTKDEIKDSPELGETGGGYDDPDYRERLGTYYGDYYGPRV
jgi:hypothetical protein